MSDSPPGTPPCYRIGDGPTRTSLAPESFNHAKPIELPERGRAQSIDRQSFPMGVPVVSEAPQMPGMRCTSPPRSVSFHGAPGASFVGTPGMPMQAPGMSMQPPAAPPQGPHAQAQMMAQQFQAQIRAQVHAHLQQVKAQMQHAKVQAQSQALAQAQAQNKNLQAQAQMQAQNWQTQAMHLQIHAQARPLQQMQPHVHVADAGRMSSPARGRSSSPQRARSVRRSNANMPWHAPQNKRGPRVAATSPAPNTSSRNPTAQLGSFTVPVQVVGNARPQSRPPVQRSVSAVIPGSYTPASTPGCNVTRLTSVPIQEFPHGVASPGILSPVVPPVIPVVLPEREVFLHTVGSMDASGPSKVVVKTVAPSFVDEAPAIRPSDFRSMADWAPPEASKWVLEALGLPPHDPLGSHIVKQEITGSVLLSLTEREMRSELGIEEFGRRRLLLLRLDALRAVQGLDARPAHDNKAFPELQADETEKHSGSPVQIVTNGRKNEHLAPQLLQAIRDDDASAVKLLLEAGAPVDSADENGIDAVSLALMRSRQLDILGSLLRSKVDVHRRTSAGWTLLHVWSAGPPLNAAQRVAAREKLRLLLEASAELDAGAEPVGATPFRMAATAFQEHRGKLQTPKESAYSRPQAEGAQFQCLLLLAAKADPLKKGSDGQSGLDIVAPEFRAEIWEAGSEIQKAIAR